PRGRRRTATASRPRAWSCRDRRARRSRRCGCHLWCSARPDRLAARGAVAGRQPDRRGWAGLDSCARARARVRNRRCGGPSANEIFTSQFSYAGNGMFTGRGPAAGTIQRQPAARADRRQMTEPFEQRPFTRRTLMRYGGVAAASLAAADPLLRAASAFAHPLRTPDSLPNPKLAPGTVDEALPFDHIVCVMMENYS